MDEMKGMENGSNDDYFFIYFTPTKQKKKQEQEQEPEKEQYIDEREGWRWHGHEEPS